MTPYDTLGVKPDATPAAIRKAFRSLAQKHHPDKGGDHAAMQAIQKAYDLLSDPERRAKFDETGSEAVEETPLTKAMSALPRLLIVCIDESADMDTTPLLTILRGRIKAEISEGQEMIKKDHKKVKQRQKAMKRLRMLHGTENMLASFIQHDITRLEAHEAHVRSVMAVFEAMMGILVDYEYECENPAIVTAATGDLAEMFAQAMQTRKTKNTSFFGL